ncbi:MAG: PRC-barrel domain-containing protein [Janthinobacterium lividum]
MLREIKKLHGIILRTTDGELGSVDEILFDDRTWTVRYLVVNTGGWLSGRQVLITPAAFGVLDWEQRVLNVNLTRTQVEDSPGIETDEPVSRQWEAEMHDYYGWPYYWCVGAMGLVGGSWYSSPLMIPAASEAAADLGAAHLTSTKDVTGYVVAARDGDIGHVEDFLVDDETWQIRCLAVDTRDWWPGKQVLLPLDWVGQISWPAGTVTAEVTRDQIKSAPYWESGKPFSPAFLEQLVRYHAQQGLGTRKIPAARAEAAVGRN